MNSEEKANNILQVILSYARLEFEQKTIVSDDEDVFDAIAAGVNMLGEELESSSISLKEKEQLLKEIHHRVKNNLQIISSLLSLQSEFIQDEKLLTIIRESKNRIHSMALIHEMLYSSKKINRVNVHDYVTRLFDSIYETFQTNQLDIYFEIEINRDLELGIDTMILLGLILNEIVTNSIKYAFPDKKGKIVIDITSQENQYTLIILDNGIGLPINYKEKQTKSLGLQLINMLSEQLDGVLQVDISRGTKYELIFRSDR